MPESKHTHHGERPHGLRNGDSADERARKGQSYTAGASGEQHISLDGQMGPDELSEPDEVVRNYEAKHIGHEDPHTHEKGPDTRPDHSEREMAGDQDIDTAGMIPGNKATDTP